MRPGIRWALALVMGGLALAALAPARAADPADADKGIAAAMRAALDAIRTETLPNGLKVYLVPVPGAPTVTTMVAYKVGAADEDKAQTGLSHYLEHLLFKGTDKYLPGDIDRATQRNGGRNNAYTSEDMTVYHFDFAADKLGIALEIEADRMRNVRIDAKHEFEQEKGAVVAELKGGEDQPFGLESKVILPLLYPAEAPYSHPVIGQESHVRGATAEVIKRYYDQWYYPNNASLIIAGGFEPAPALEQVRKLFGGIPKGELPPRRAESKVARRAAPVRKEFASKFDVARLLMGFNTVDANHPDDPALTVLNQVMSGGRTGRLYLRLVEKDRLVSSVSSSSSTGRYAGWTGITLELLQGKDRATAEAALLEELAKLRAAPVSDAELKRAKRQVFAGLVFARDDVHSLANLVASAVTVSDLDYLKTTLDKLAAVTADDLVRVATTYYAPEGAVYVWSVPAEASRPAAGAAPPAAAVEKPRRQPPTGAAGGGGGGAVRLADAKKLVLPDGLTLVTLENHRLPMAVASLSIKNAARRETADQAGIATLVSDLLEEGTAKRTGQEIASAIEDVGGSLSFSRGGASLKVLAPDLPLGLELMFDSLANPSFPAEAFERVKEQQLSVIAGAETEPRARASDEFARLVYGEAHPQGHPARGKRDTVSKLTAEDCKRFHKSAYTPAETILVVVGDIDPKAVAELVTKLTAAWKPEAGAAPVLPAPPERASPLTRVLSDPTAAQTHVFLGHLGVTRADPDYYALQVMDNVLGTGPGFTDRLSATLRDRQGLAYTVTAQIAGSATDLPGTFTGYIGTFPDKFAVVRDGFLQEIARIRSEPATEQEVADAKRYLLGSLAFRVSTSDAVAGQLLAAERYGLGFDFLDKYRAEVEKVTPARVLEVARKHLRPQKLVVVACGPISESGEALKKPGER